MSGGSWGYLYEKLGDAAQKLTDSRCPHRRALGTRLKKYCDALYAVEWVDSCDWSPGDEIGAIRKALGDDITADADVLAELIADAKRVRDEIAEYLVEMDRHRERG